jgi:thymidylate synthase (FAD)
MNDAKIVAVTEPRIIERSDSWFHKSKQLTIDEFIAYVARVSNPSNQNNHLTSEKLLKYLVKHKHWSPFEMVNVVMEINTTRDIARQILRHRSFSFQEFSQRYADPTSDLGFVERETRLQDEKNRQNSIETNDEELQKCWYAKQKQQIHEAKLAYKWAVENGIAKEQARSVLPEGLTVSRMYMNGTLRSWIHYCEIRMAEGTQKEHREVATSAWNEIIREFPSLSSVKKLTIEDLLK